MKRKVERFKELNPKEYNRLFAYQTQAFTRQQVKKIINKLNYEQLKFLLEFLEKLK